MKTWKLAIGGAVLLLCVVLAGIGLRVLGPGLVTTQRAPRPRTATPVQENRPAFALKGTFADEFDNKRNCSGSFEVRASGLIALINTTFEHGYREFVGSGGRDTFQYAPFSGDKTVEPPPQPGCHFKRPFPGGCQLP
jgi:hypothetical protein